MLRIHDLTYSEVVSVLVRSLPPEVTSLMLVTPTDTKMFEVTAGKGASYAPAQRERPQAAAETEIEAAEEPAGGEDDDPQLRAVREAEAEERSSRRASVAAAVPPSEDGEIDYAQRALEARARREERRAEAGEASDPCGRCGGAGQIQIALPDGGSSVAACGVCSGRGTIRRYGVRRAR